MREISGFAFWVIGVRQRIEIVREPFEFAFNFAGVVDPVRSQ
jgi:hypothetical protein